MPPMQKSQTYLLEVGHEGLRLLRPGTEDSLYMHPWGQIHSWAHGRPSRFTFRYFDDGKHAIMSCNITVRDLDQLLDHIQTTIDHILMERKALAIPDDAFAVLVGRLKGSEPSAHMDILAAAVKDVYLMSEQGRVIMNLLTSAFDKVEAAVLLHGHLIDQNCFCNMLASLEAQADRDNVWHRITLNKRQKLSGGGRSSSKMAAIL